MSFKKIAVLWSLITIICAAAFYFVRILFRSHPLWPWIFPYLYIGLLILLVLYLLSEKKK